MQVSNRKLVWVGLAASVSLLFLPACARQARYHSFAEPQEKGYRQVGLASWYGKRFKGRRTASGRRFNPKELTAAHRTLPFGTRVRITNLVNAREVEVEITDRGPFIRRRIIDVSHSAAKMLGMVQTGTAHVRIEVLSDEEDHGDRIPQ